MILLILLSCAFFFFFFTLGTPSAGCQSFVVRQINSKHAVIGPDCWEVFEYSFTKKVLAKRTSLLCLLTNYVILIIYS